MRLNARTQVFYGTPLSKIVETRTKTTYVTEYKDGKTEADYTETQTIYKIGGKTLQSLDEVKKYTRLTLFKSGAGEPTHIGVCITELKLYAEGWTKEVEAVSLMHAREAWEERLKHIGITDPDTLGAARLYFNLYVSE